MKSSAGSGEWLEKALIDLCGNLESGLDLDRDLISGLVSYCELAPPQDAQEYLSNIIGQESGQSVIEEYLQRRGYTDSCNSTPSVQSSKLQPYMKPHANEGRLIGGTKKQTKTPKEVILPSTQDSKKQTGIEEPKSISKGNVGTSKGNVGASKKKKSGKVISLAEAAKGSIVFQQGKSCSCQARRHKLVSNCLSCGKIVCEQEGEGPCGFCGALVLREGSTYAGLDDTSIPLSDAEVAAEAFAKRLVEYDQNSAARTTVIDDQSDYYEIEGNSWLSAEDKDLLKKKQQEAEQAKRSKVVVTFDLVGRKVMVNEDEVSELKSEHSILRPQDERELNRIQPNPTIRVQPVFVDPGTSRNPVRAKQNTRLPKGICLEISGRVQPDISKLQLLTEDDSREIPSYNRSWQGPSVSGVSNVHEDEVCSIDYN